MKQIYKNILLIALLSLTNNLNANDFKKFQEYCNNIGALSGYSSNRNIAKAIKEATKDSGSNLVIALNGATISGSSFSKASEILINDKVDIKEIFKDESSEISGGFIYYKRVRAFKGKEYKRHKDKTIEVKAKLSCDRKMYEDIQNHILKKTFENEKVCIISKSNKPLSIVAIDEMNEYLLNQKTGFDLYECVTNDTNKLKKDGYTKVFVLKIKSQIVKTQIGSQLILKLTSKFKNLTTNKLYGVINLTQSNFTQYKDKNTIKLLNENNIKNIISNNTNKLLLQIINKKGK